MQPPIDLARYTQDILQKVRQLEIRTRRQVNSRMMGGYHSSFKGHGIQFEELREYLPGDDVRSIDWNVSARMHKPFIKKYREERELSIVLLADVSASNNFGLSEDSKRRLMAEVASMIAVSAINNQDKVGLALFTRNVEHYLPAKKGRVQALRILRELLFFEPKEAGTDLSATLATLSPLLKRPAVVFIFSDFLEPTEAFRHALTLISAQHDTICMHIQDAHERSMPDIPWIVLEDAETGALASFNAKDPAVRLAYAKASEERIHKLNTVIQKAGASYVPLHTNQDYWVTLYQFFSRHGHRR